MKQFLFNLKGPLKQTWLLKEHEQEADDQMI